MNRILSIILALILITAFSMSAQGTKNANKEIKQSANVECKKDSTKKACANMKKCSMKDTTKKDCPKKK